MNYCCTSQFSIWTHVMIRAKRNELGIGKLAKWRGNDETRNEEVTSPCQVEEAHGDSVASNQQIRPSSPPSHLYFTVLKQIGEGKKKLTPCDKVFLDNLVLVGKVQTNKIHRIPKSKEKAEEFSPKKKKKKKKKLKSEMENGSGKIRIIKKR